MSNVDPIETLKRKIREEAEALFEMESAPSTPSLVSMPRQRTGDLAEPTEAMLYSLLRRRGYELVRLILQESVEKTRGNVLSTRQVIAGVQQAYSFLSDVWLTAGGFSAASLIATCSTDRILSLRPKLWHDAISFCHAHGWIDHLDLEYNALLGAC